MGLTLIAGEVSSIIQTDTKNINDAIVNTGAINGGKMVMTLRSVTVYSNNGTYQNIGTALPIPQLFILATTYNP